VTRVPIPRDIAAQVLFEHDRTCCVCRSRGKSVQVHHIDDEPSNNDPANLAVLCFDCHRDTQITGGFDRKLDSDQVLLYRDDWCRCVGRQRAMLEVPPNDAVETKRSLEVAEVYKRAEDYEHLAMHFEVVGNPELRDKYIELAITKGVDDQTMVFLRGNLQGRPDLIPQNVIDREYKRYTRDRDWLQRARFHKSVGKPREAVKDYSRGIFETLKEGRTFSAAFYLKELAGERLEASLFLESLREFKEAKDLWWQVRALQELGWQEEVRDLVLKHAAEIEAGRDPYLRILLAHARGDEAEVLECEKQIARGLSRPG